MKKLFFLICTVLVVFTSCEKDDDVYAWLYGTWNLDELTIYNSDGSSDVLDKELLDSEFSNKTMEFDKSKSCKIKVVSIEESSHITLIDDTYTYTISLDELHVGKWNTKYIYDGESLAISGDGSFIYDKFNSDDEDDSTYENEGLKMVYKFTKQE